jgi:fatty-acyl-CoA synthase
LHKRGAYLNSLAQIIEFGMTPDSKYLWTLPIFHCSGWCFSWAVSGASATHVLLKKIDYDLIWDLFKNHGISHYCAAPTVNTFLVHNPHALKLERPVKLMVAGSPPSPTLLSQLNQVNIHPLHVYGLTEVFGPMTLNLPQEMTKTLPIAEQEARAARQGNANIVSDEVRVVNKDSMIDVPMDGKTMGEVIIRGNTTMRGYYNDAEATAKAFKGGWFHSGDVAVRHADGYIEIMDRDKDIIISGGENISTGTF